MTHDERHIVSNLIGTTDMHIALGPEIELSSNDTVIVCSDGLFDNLMLAEIIDTGRKGPLEEASNALARLSQERMSGATGHLLSKPDDLTVITFRPKRRESKQVKCA
jgi:serine/threonine protein phosphatase PrpC